jgi:exonuclease VII small subunit
MSTVAKVFVVLNLLLAVAFLGAAAAFLGHSDNWKARHDTLKLTSDKQIGDLDASVKTLTARVATQENNVASANAEKDTAQKAERLIAEAYGNLKTFSDQANVSYQNASKALQTAQDTIKNGRALVDTLQAERTKLIDEIRAAKDEALASTTAKNNAENALELATNQLQDANTKLTNAELELQRVRFRLEAIIRTNPSLDATTAQPWQQAKVLQADNEANVIVISLGSEDDVKAGYRYTVSRGSSFVAEIQITNVQTKSAVGKVLTGLGKQPVRAGDDVMTSK